MRIGTLPDGTKGFDCNEPVSLSQARAFYGAGYRFVVRYVPRVTPKLHDITARELVNVLLGGLGVMIVQHVANPGWKATHSLGTAYGNVAAEEAKRAGYPTGCVLWCDLEEVTGSHAEVIDYCNAWYDQVTAHGFEAGLYVGYGAVLTAEELYRKLRFRRYWSAYNLNADRVPAVRGVQMRQKAYPPPSQRVPGIPFQYDENIIKADAFGDSPVMLLP